VIFGDCESNEVYEGVDERKSIGYLRSDELEKKAIKATRELCDFW
jgi:hypothetical protein